jgi:HK97 gp10 family phage protein
MPTARNAIEVEGLQQLRRALRAIGKDAQKEGQTVVREAAQIVAAQARLNAPRRTGRLRDSIRGTTSGVKGVVRSPLPYAKVHEYGGVIRPRGAPIVIRESAFVERAITSKADEVVEKLADGIDRVARRHGFR